MAIETSCDDTCIAIGEGKTFFDFSILDGIVSSQIKIHRPFGGIWPTLARREHQKNLVYVLKRVLKESGLLKKNKKEKEVSKEKIESLKKIFKKESLLFKKTLEFFKKYQKPKIDVIAVTVGPGLEPCLWTGVNFAKALSLYFGTKIVPVNHIEAHIFASSLSKEKRELLKSPKRIFPAVCLIVSGGHTQLIFVKKLGKYKILGETRDDAAGEAFDKIARILGLPYPGGPEIEKLANYQMDELLTNQVVKLPRPMIYSKNYDFSFSGLKTAVLHDYKRRSKKIKESREYISLMAKEAQEAIVEVLVKKTIKAQKEFGAKSIILGGGVSANKRLKEVFQREIQKLKKPCLFIFPEKRLATDNAEMVAFCGYFGAKKSDKIKNWRKIRVYPNLKLQ
ncbi:MAG: tRNA (adenosine(37)-N6)-threonylcarbamoyltransferase complex transferase subunit TsaD [Candidatus Pacebacteria bacterium]|nr:tRNA (adenosine(37)-N6)-threonylcarbamoyltransferase complex transferase subunit TsaD [Candidatus Paceibacterota bacterium]